MTLIPHLRSTWESLYQSKGYMHNQSPLFLDSYQMAYPSKDVKVIPFQINGNPIISVFVVQENIAVSLFTGWPILSERSLKTAEWKQYLESSFDQLQPIDGIYFPLVYSDLPGAKQLSNVPNLQIGKRLPNPIINWKDKGKGLHDRAVKRLGSVVERRLKKFQTQSFICRDVAAPEAISAIAYIEQKSWKSDYGQDMFTRNQFQLYKKLIESGLLYTRIALDASVPIAYRIDSKVNNRIISIKWSYNNNYRTYSPGFFLAVQGYYDQYRQSPIEEIDLFGSPDTLKDALYTTQKPRCDFGWPSSKAIKDQINLRLRHDQLIHCNYKQKRSIKYAYK